MTWKPLGILVIIGFMGSGGLGWAGEEHKKDRPAADPIGASAKDFMGKIEREMTGVVKKLEESDLPKKVGHELKRSAEFVGQKVEQAGKALKEQFQPE